MPNTAASTAANTLTLRHELKGHTSWVYSLAFTPDGQTLASGGWDEWIRFWDVETGQAGHVLEGHKSEVYCLAFSPDGKTLASGSANNTSFVKLWDTRTGEELNELIGHKNVVHCLGWSPDGRYLASGGYDRAVRVWDVNGAPGDASLQATLTGFNHKLYSVQFSPDGQALHAAQADKVTRSFPRAAFAATVSRPGQASQPKVITSDPAWVHATAISPDARHLACAYGRHRDDRAVEGHVEIRDIATGLVVGELIGHRNFVHSVAFDHTGSRLVTGGWDGEIRTWEAATGKLLTRTPAADTPVLAVAFSPDGQTIASAGYDQVVRIFAL